MAVLRNILRLAVYINSTVYGQNLVMMHKTGQKGEAERSNNLRIQIYGESCISGPLPPLEISHG